MKTWILFVGFIIFVLVAAIVLKSSSCRSVKQQQLYHAQSHAAVTSVVQTTSNDSQINGQKTASYTLSKEVNKALEHGAKARVTLKVVDSSGNSVPNARVHVHFTFYNRNINEVTGVTDSSGMFTAEKETTLSFQWNIQKDGYYTTNGKHFLTDGLSNNSVKNGCWQPWNPVIEVVLKEKRKPISMYVKSIELPMPIRDAPIGFDFLEGDWVSPYGKGVVSDMQLTYIWEKKEDGWRRHNFTISFTNGIDGAYVLPKDEYSVFKSHYEADLMSIYTNTLNYTYERTNTKIIADEKLTDNQVLVFRVRTPITKNDTLDGGHYGKIYGSFHYAQGQRKLIRFSYYLNPTRGDTNLEFDGETNLFNPDWRDYKWPKEP